MRIAAVLALAWFATSAHADRRAPAGADASGEALERAQGLEAQLEYEQALAVIDAELRAGRSGRDRLAELYLFAGRLTAGLDRARDAEAQFAAALALRPLLTLPGGTSPKLTAPFDAARARSVPLDIRLVVTTDHVAVQPVADPLGLVRGIGVRFRRLGHAHADSARDLASTRFARDPDILILEVRALDRYGNELWSGTPPADPIVPIEVSPVRDEPSRFERWPTWAVITGVALAAGGVSAWRFDSAQHAFDRGREAGLDFTALQAIERRGERWALAANASFGVAAATGITGIIMLVRGGGEATVAVTAGPGTGLGVAGRF